MSIDQTAKALMAAMEQKAKPEPFDTTATVTRTEGDTLWVHIPGGVDETPIKKTVGAKAGDEIQVRVAGGSAWATGNASAPPTDDMAANAARTMAEEALEYVKIQRADIQTLQAEWANIGTAIIQTLQANGIDADWITTGQGGNLYPNYDSFEQVTSDTIAAIKSGSATVTVNETNYARYGRKVLRIATAAGVTDGYVFPGVASNGYGQIRLEPGTYVASIYFRNTSGAVSASLGVYGRTEQSSDWSDSSKYSLLGSKLLANGSGWTRIEVPFTATSTYPFVCLRISLRTESQAMLVDCCQIEKVASLTQGAGEWHPAGTVMIDWGNVAANSVKANSIDTDDLMTKNLTATGSFQVNNGVYKLAQTTNGFALSSLASGINSTEIIANNTSGIQLKTYNNQGITLNTGNLTGKVTINGVVFDAGGNITKDTGTAMFYLTKTVTGTTTAAGNVSLGLDRGTYEVISVRRTDASSICTPYTIANGTWYAHVTSSAATPAAVTSTKVTLAVTYFSAKRISPN